MVGGYYVRNSSDCPFPAEPLQYYEGQSKEWEVMLFDISSYANADLRIRFGFATFLWKPMELALWNIDDIRLLTTTTPGTNCCTWEGDCDPLEQECLFGKCE